MHTLLTHTFCLMCHTQELYLNRNQIGDKGMISLSDALGKGALASLKTLVLDENKIGDDGLKALAEACRAKGALASLRELALERNAIGDVGLHLTGIFLPCLFYIPQYGFRLFL